MVSRIITVKVAFMVVMVVITFMGDTFMREQ